jgi:hypothetical protein
MNKHRKQLKRAWSVVAILMILGMVGFSLFALLSNVNGV